MRSFIDLTNEKNYRTSYNRGMRLDKFNIIPIKDKLYEVSINKEKPFRLLIIEMLEGVKIDITIKADKLSIASFFLYRGIMKYIARDSLKPSDYYV